MSTKTTNLCSLYHPGIWTVSTNWQILKTRQGRVPTFNTPNIQGDPKKVCCRYEGWHSSRSWKLLCNMIQLQSKRSIHSINLWGFRPKLNSQNILVGQGEWENLSDKTIQISNPKVLDQVQNSGLYCNHCFCSCNCIKHQETWDLRGRC